MLYLTDLDRWLFFKINTSWTDVILDIFFPAITDLHKDRTFIGLLLLFFLLRLAKNRAETLKWSLILVVAVGCSDLFSYRVVKKIVQRPRPAEAGLQVNLRTSSHSGSSFPSNHTANVFAAAYVLTAASAFAGPFVFFIAALVGYSRIYVGVHYPMDVLAGAAIGILIAIFTIRLLRPRLWPEKPSETPRFIRFGRR